MVEAVGGSERRGARVPRASARGAAGEVAGEDGGGGRAAAKCYKCNGMGHWAQDCPQG